MERRVEGECLARIDAEDFKAEDLLFELQGDIGVGLGVQRVFLENALGFFK